MRFCPVLFERPPTSRNGEEESLSEGTFDPPYRMVFALATADTVIIGGTAGDVYAFMLSDTPWHELYCLTYEIAGHMGPVTVMSCHLPFEELHCSEHVQPTRLIRHCSCMIQLSGTAEQHPLPVLGGLHSEAAPVTDIAWSCDGRYLAISSYDGEWAMCNRCTSDLFD